jgi:hypothetical protein
MFICALVVNLAYILLTCQLHQHYILLLSAIVSTYYYATRATQQKVWTISKLLYGEAPHQILYLLWLYYFPKDEYIYFIPLALSTVGKLNILFDPNS